MTVSHELTIQSYLRSGESLDSLKERYAIKHRRHLKHTNLVLFKYNQLDSPFAEQIVRECRGIVLDEDDNWRVVSRAFDKFFNHGEGHAAELDWKTARVQEKVDGSLCVLYEYDDDWHVATTGTPDGSGYINLTSQRFSDLFWETWSKHAGTNDLLPSEKARGHSFFFELTSPMNRVVVRHMEPSLTLLGARHLESGRELRPDDARALLEFVYVPSVREFELRSIDDITQSFSSLSPLSHEGYVIVDESWNRIKVKHPGYVALHHAKDGINRKAFVEIARNGETSEVLTAFPEFAPMLEDAKSRLNNLVSYLEGAYDAIKDLESQKDFALRATKTRFSGALFSLRAKKVGSIREALAQVQIDRLVDLLGYDVQSDNSPKFPE